MKKFNSKEALSESLCADIVRIIAKVIEEKGQAHVLLSGGSSPIYLYELMSGADLDWSKVLVGLVDERFVATDDEFSNEKMIREKLIQNRAIAVEFVGMVDDSTDEIQNLKSTSLKYQRFFDQLDLVLLGMGEDGHTASLFPNDEVSEKLLQSNEIGIYDTKSPNYPKNRITCSAALLLKAENILLMLSGENKLRVFENSIDQKLPISYFTNKLKVYYSI